MLEYIKKVTKKEIIKEPYIENGKRCLKLSEGNEQGKLLYTFTFLDVPQDSVLIRLDEKFLETRNIFISSSNDECKNKNDFEHYLCKKADYLLIDSENKTIFVIELKSSSHTEEHIIAQLKGGFCILKYIEAIINNFSNLFRYKSSLNLPFDGFSYRFMSIKHIKNATKGNKLQDSKNYKDFSSADKFLHLRGRDKIIYNHLV
ncbi:hypothetical protein Q7458_11900 [Glaesserella parasuis]|uniref:hypothetical protein n=1 Tax=Glaesserella parasuis TaxID=738 RepID=UPI0003ABE8F1|nr:hypothetical protein [Glaesserella parasuis]ATW42414.1 hypothetical protein A2U20_00605 [Glaesserella parasuis D74]ATW42454.1 hypothetical protein A2U20_00835 [Glaesserella parasuis D74]EQA07947.1 hypothetical protein HPSD74_1756 [Glaesserella parasuis D74]MDG6474847.1 hypothetical protein [Glaesserella parasuis]MDO9800124.1 hypothetical protein [Glaesserella parasuis]